MSKTVFACFIVYFSLFGLQRTTRAEDICHYTAELISSTGEHFGRGTFTLNGTKLVYLLFLHGRVSPEIHGPAEPEADAPLLFTLAESGGAADEIPVSLGEVSLTSEQISQLASGQWYVSVNGTYRGQIVPNTRCRAAPTTPIFLSTTPSKELTATFWLNGTLLDWEISLPDGSGSYTASLLQNRSREYRGGLQAYMGSLDCTNLLPCITRGQICLPEHLISQLLDGHWSLLIWNHHTGLSFQATIAPPDTDNDGVADYRDQCSNTPPNVAINSQGCSIDQICPCEGRWNNHAEYVKCVRIATTEFATNGIITTAQAERAVRLAITHDCGKRDGALFPLAVPFAPYSDLPDDAWICGYWDFELELSGTNQVPPVDTEFIISAWVPIDFCFTPKHEFPTAGDIRVYTRAWPPPGDYSLAIYGPASRSGPDVKLFDVLPCEQWYFDYCVSLTDAQLRDALNGRYWLYVLSDAFPSGFLRARIAVPDGDNDGVSDILDSCPTTPPGAVVNDHGCRIEDICPCNAQWTNRGEYVNCVQSAADNLLKSGIITGSQKEKMVKQARGSDCGRH